MKQIKVSFFIFNYSYCSFFSFNYLRIVDEIQTILQDYQNSSFDQDELLKCGKYHFYYYESDNQLNREPIYANQDTKCKEKFINQFKVIEEHELLKIIFKEESIYKQIFNNSNLIELLKYFIDKHNSCDFERILKQVCPIPQYDHGLNKFTRQEDVAKYVKTILESVLKADIIGQNNFFSILKW